MISYDDTLDAEWEARALTHALELRDIGPETKLVILDELELLAAKFERLRLLALLLSKAPARDTQEAE